MKLSNRLSDDSGATKGAKTTPSAKSKGTKLVVRNVPFECTKQELRQLFMSVFFFFI
jgi:hypothetical protein